MDRLQYFILCVKHEVKVFIYFFPILSSVRALPHCAITSSTVMCFGVTKGAANHLTQCLDSRPHTTDPHYQTVNHCPRNKSRDSSQTPTPARSFHTWYQIAL